MGHRARLSLFNWIARPKAIRSKIPRTIMASISVSLPEARGRSLVRDTKESIRRSAMSLMTQPALLITKDPRVKINRSRREGVPWLAMTSDQRVGIKSRIVPYCLVRRIRSVTATILFLVRNTLIN